jgi:serine/threonine protein kinase
MGGGSSSIEISGDASQPQLVFHDPGTNISKQPVIIAEMAEHLQHSDSSVVQVTRVLGKGAFAIVQLATWRNHTLVVKTMKKSALIRQQLGKRRREDALAMAEIEVYILRNFSHPFVVKLHGACQDDRRVHIFLEYCSGGDLYQRMQDDPRLVKAGALFYLRELVLALEFLHAHDVLIGDLKPENILLDSDGHIRVADFGMSECFIGKRRVPACRGTPEYQAPEQADGTCGRAVDMWAFGCIAFEMFCGRLPFPPPFTERRLENMKSGVLRFRGSTNQSVRHLLTGVLFPNPDTRFTIADIKAHPVFDGTDWDAVFAKTAPVPWVPTGDHFDEQFTSLPVQPIIPSAADDDDDDDEEVGRTVYYARGYTLLRHD